MGVEGFRWAQSALNGLGMFRLVQKGFIGVQRGLDGVQGVGGGSMVFEEFREAESGFEGIMGGQRGIAGLRGVQRGLEGVRGISMG